MMKKLLILLLMALFGLGVVASTFAQNQSNFNTNVNRPAVKTFDPVCVQNAIEKRDSAIIDAWDVYSAKVKSALETRKNELKAAWGKTDNKEKKKAIRAAWEKYRKSVRDARRALNDAKKAAWKQYRTDAKACKNVPRELESKGEGADANL